MQNDIRVVRSKVHVVELIAGKFYRSNSRVCGYKDVTTGAWHRRDIEEKVPFMYLGVVAGQGEFVAELFLRVLIGEDVFFVKRHTMARIVIDEYG